jgi:L-fucose mutarotase
LNGRLSRCRIGGNRASGNGAQGHHREDFMLKGLDPRLNAEVLYALRAMGHGDTLIIADTNFPSDTIARQTVLGELLRMDNLTSAQAAEAVLSVLPLDTFVDDFAGRMEIVGSPDEIAPVQAEVQAVIDAAEGRPRPMVGIERFAFYDTANQAYAVIQTGERRFYGCFMLRKGVIPPDA